MANTTNFGWETPDDTDLVKDGALAMRTLGNAIDTSLVDLKGGTSGQILAKNSNTDMDFVWIANDQGDITAVTAGTGISGGGTSGAVTITNSMATAIDAKGDLIVGTGADTFDRLAVGGTNGHVLMVDSSTSTGVKWAASAGGDFIKVGTASPSAAASASIDSAFTSTYENYLVMYRLKGSVQATLQVRMRTSGSDNTNATYNTQLLYADGTTVAGVRTASAVQWDLGTLRNDGLAGYFYIYAPQLSERTFLLNSIVDHDGFTVPRVLYHGFNFNNTTSFDGIKFYPSTGNMTGEIKIYGMVN
jgi:hypothetical protein